MHVCNGEYTAHYYIPDTAATGQILRELVVGMLYKLDVTVICVGPICRWTIEDKYNVLKYYEKEINGVKVLKIQVLELCKTNQVERVKNILSYFFGAMEATFKVVEKFKVGTKTADAREVAFVFAGAGSVLTTLVGYVAEHHMENVAFIPYQDIH